MNASTFELAIEQDWSGRALRRAECNLVELRRTAGTLEIMVDARFADDVPPPPPAASTEGLWHYEVVEVFVAADATAGTSYTEIELSPHGHHLVLRFDAIRRRVAEHLPLSFTSSICGARWKGHATLALEHLPPPPWRANAFAVRGAAPRRRYLAAVPLPGDRPDFHQPASFPLLG
jgi:hypothetical protein